MKKLVLGLILSVGMSGMAFASSTIELDLVAKSVKSDFLTETCFNQDVTVVYNANGTYKETTIGELVPRECSGSETEGTVKIIPKATHLKEETTSIF